MKTKTKSEIEKELIKLRQRITELESSDSKRTSARSAPKDRKVEQELRETRSYLENILNTVPIHIASIDINGKYKSWNKASEDMFGFTAEEAIGKLTPSRFHRNDEEARAVISMVEREGKFDDELILVRRDGSEFPVHLLVTRTVDSSGNHIGFTGVAIDITERLSAEQAEKRAKKELANLYAESQEARKSLLNILADVLEKEKALRESEKRFRDVVNNTGDWIWEIDEEWRYTYSSQVVKQIVGYEDKEVLGKHFYDFFYPDERDELKKAAFEIFGQKESFKNFINRNVHKDGHIVILETSGVPLLDDSGNLLGYRGVVRDITDLKYAEEKMLLANERLQHLLYSSPTIIYSCETSGDYDITFISENVFIITGYLSENFIKDQKLWIDRIYPEDREYVEKMMATILKKGYLEIEYRFQNKDGIYIWLRDTKKLIRDINGVPVEIIGSVLNITKRKQAEEALQESENKLRRSQKIEAVGKLAGGIAHDFNNLLTIISGYSQLTLDRLNNDDPMRKNIKKIIKAGEQAATLTRQLLAFSRKQILEPKVLDLNTVVTDVEKMLGRLIGEDIKMETVLEPELEHVKIDKCQIEQVIMNLVVNARDAMPEGGKITIRTENVDIDKALSKITPEAFPGKFVRFSIEDTGVSIDKAILDQIFEPFFTTKEAGTGTGHGLSVVYGIIKQHDGWINVYSEPGQGTIFKIYLPAVSAEIEDEIKDTIILKDFRGSGERILLVEDEEGIREFAAETLCENGYIIFEAANAKEAIELFKDEDGNFDIIFSDVVMPGKSGLQLVDEFLSSKPDLRVMLCSGYLDKKSHRHEIKKRGFRFLQKPYSVVDLLKTIREILEQK